MLSRLESFAETKLTGAKPYALLAVVYLVVAAGTWYMFGVKVVADSDRYLEYADGLRSGVYVDPFNIWYIGYVLFLFVVRLFATQPLAIVTVQYVVSFVAVIAIYKASIALFKNRFSAIVSGSLYMCFAEIIAWNSYVIPEGIYSSFIAVALYFIVRKKQATGQWVVAAAAIFFAIVIKPTGIALVGALVAIVICKQFQHSKQIVTRWGIIAAALVVFLFVGNYMLDSYIIIGNYLKGEIIYGITTLPDHPDFKLLTIEVPADVYVPGNDESSLVQILSFILHNPLFFIKLFLAKIFYLLFHIKPYWSFTHALFIGAILFPSYCFFVRAQFTNVLPSWLRVFSITYVALHVIIIGMTSEDWDGRFLMPILPIVFLLAPAGIMRNSLTK